MNRSLATLPDFASATDFSASAAKAKLGEVIDLVAAGGLATITRRGRQRFAVLKLETVEALVAAAREQELEALGERYDELVARMQTPEAQAGVDALFTASGGEVGAGARLAASGGDIGAPGARAAASGEKLRARVAVKATRGQETDAGAGLTTSSDELGTRAAVKAASPRSKKASR